MSNDIFEIQLDSTTERYRWLEQDGKKYFSLIDVTMWALGVSRDHASKAVRRVLGAAPAVRTLCPNCKFPGERQRLTPVATAEGLAEFLPHLPKCSKRTSKERRAYVGAFLRHQARLLIGFAEADPRLVANLLSRMDDESRALLAEGIIDAETDPDRLRRLELRAGSKRANLLVNGAIKAIGATNYAEVAQLNCLAITGKMPYQIRNETGKKSAREAANDLELASYALADSMEAKALFARAAIGQRGNAASREAALGVTRLIEETHAKFQALLPKSPLPPRDPPRPLPYRHPPLSLPPGVENSPPEDLLYYLTSSGFKVWRTGDRLFVDPRERLSPELDAYIAARKDKVLALLPDRAPSTPRLEAPSPETPTLH